MGRDPGGERGPVEGIRESARGGRRWLQLALTLLFVALLVGLLDLREVAATLRSAHPGWLLLALGVAVLDRILMIAKWYPLLAVHAPVVSFAQAARSYIAASFTNYFLPSTLGSDALRAAALGRPHGLTMEVGASIAAERLFGMLANGVLVLVSVGVGLRMALSVGMAGALSAALLVAAGAAVVLPFFDRARALAERLVPSRLLGRHEQLLRRFASAYADYRRHPRLLAGVGVLTLLEVFFPLAILWILSFALDVHVPLLALLVAVPISQLVAKLPISIAGIGPQEATLVSGLAVLDVPAESALALAIPNRLLDVLIALPGALLWRDLARGLRRGPVAATAAAQEPPGPGRSC